MCPEWEREEREYQNNVDLLERVRFLVHSVSRDSFLQPNLARTNEQYPGTTRIDPTRAVKAFHRPAAGNDQPLPSDVRPPHILKSTLDYLFHTLLPTAPLHVTHPFLRDRTRAIRQDFTMQNERGVVAIECNERIARYHVLALGTLREQSGFSESQELEQLRKGEYAEAPRFTEPPYSRTKQINLQFSSHSTSSTTTPDLPILPSQHPTKPNSVPTTSSPISVTPTSSGHVNCSLHKSSTTLYSKPPSPSIV